MQNRSIKFRAWDGEKMIYSGTMSCLSIEKDQNSYFFKIVREDSIVMQFTGLLDKVGNEIYEGDILAIPEYYDTPEMTSTKYINWEVFYFKSSFNLRNQNHLDPSDDENLDCAMSGYDSNFEVIGNIYQHSHLLEKGASNA